MSFLSAVWRWISRGPYVGTLPDSVMMEFALLCCIAPLMYTDLRLAIDPEVSASDASEKGGGLCYTLGLSQLGVSRVTSNSVKLDNASG